MSNISDLTTTAPQGEELDDFAAENHGLKEIALGLSAASIVAGGAGAMSLTLDNPLPGATAGVQPAVSGAQAEAQRTADGVQGVTDRALDRAGSEVHDLQSLADRSVTFVATTAVPVVDLAPVQAQEAVHLATQVAADPIGAGDGIVDGGLSAARDTPATTTAGTAYGAVDPQVEVQAQTAGPPCRPAPPASR